MRSPSLSAPTNSAPRCPATVSPEVANSRLLTTVVVTPAAASRLKAVGCGCHSLGSTHLLHSRAFRRSSVPGILEVNPTTPWVPGISAVPREVRLVAGVHGPPGGAAPQPPGRQGGG